MQRLRRWLPILVLLALLGSGFEVDRARADAIGRSSDPYRAGPLAAREVPVSLEGPGRSEELLVLGGIAAILYGFRASGLARDRGLAARARRGK